MKRMNFKGLRDLFVGKRFGDPRSSSFLVGWRPARGPRLPRAATPLPLAEQQGQTHPAARVRAARGNPAGPDVRGVHERGVEDHRAVHPVLHHLDTGGAAASCQCEAI